MQEASALYDDFADFIKAYDKPENGELLQGFLLEWLEHGDAVVESGGNFGTYLKGVVLIIARWLDNPSMLDFQGSIEKPPRIRRATGLLHLNEGGALCLDRDYFRTILMRRLVQRD
jgi:hypothetical protein